MAESFRAPIGTQDVLPPESARWQALIATFADVAARFGYGLVHGPLFEDIGVFQRLGAGTDVVRKEMYDFHDKGDRHLALRPEATASVARAFVQHRPVTPWKVWCVTPAFRYESPQAGRFRQHHQVDVEVLGVADPDLDVEVLALAADYLDRVGLRRWRLALNTMGTPDDRRAYIAQLRAWLGDRVGDLDPDDQEKAATHPLRVLDSKRRATQAVVADAPRMLDSLDPASVAHFERVQAGLTALEIPFEIDTRLVRGLDYYTHTLFEFQSLALDNAQSTVIGGGRYDGLVEQLGGPPTPGIGFGSGIERMLLAVVAEQGEVELPSALDVFVVDTTDGSVARDLTHELRAGGLRVDRAFDGRSMKAQMKAAGRSGARVALIIGEQEAAEGTVTVRDMVDAEQTLVPRDQLATQIHKLLEDRVAGTAPAFGMRTHWCGELTSADVGSKVSLCGWVARRRDHGEHLAFMDLRDREGVVQCVIDGGVEVRSEWVVRVTGTVRVRPEGTTNPNLPTGEVEVADCEVEVLSKAEAPPFPLDDRTDTDETVRLRHRYVDLRRDRLQRNLRARAKVNSIIRGSLEGQGFVEIETPMLIASTPEGARDFVVPSRLKPGHFYALPQSPQLFKQLCMVGGIDRYYQIARCLRDEDLRADRQFEFMQLDLEASFVGQDDILAVTSQAIAATAEALTGQVVGEIPQMTWAEAMERFGSDKPDIRFGLELVELTERFAATEFKAFAGQCVKGIRVPGAAEGTTRKRLDELTDMAKRWGAKGLVWMRVQDDSLDSPVAKFLSEDELAGIRTQLEAEPGDLVFLVADKRRTVRHVLGLLRLELGRPPVTEGGLHFLWVVDFPLFEGLSDEGKPIPAHHPFTRPHPDDLDLLDATDPEDLLKIRSQAYDLVLNGWELGSGSVRIHETDLQTRIFGLLGIGQTEAQAKFGFLLDAFRFGPPPHAGFAFGVDRLVALLVGEENIREVIAFPKTQSGADPLTGAPSEIDSTQLQELGLRLLPRPTT